MKAMILAAGRGERMRPLTDNLPKPLLKVGAHTLIEHRVSALRAAGIQECVINLSYRGSQIRELLGNGSQYGLDIFYSDEGNTALETAGGIIKALPLLGSDPFIVMNADIWSDFPLEKLPHQLKGLAYLVMVDNPTQHPQGDFAIRNGRVCLEGEPKLTFSGIGVYSPELFAGYSEASQALLPILQKGIQLEKVDGIHYDGQWQDIGTPERLNTLRHQLELQTAQQQS